MQVQYTRLPRMGCAIRPKDTITNPWLLIQPTSPLRSSQHFVHYVHQPHVSQTLPHQESRTPGNNKVMSKRRNITLAKIPDPLSRSSNERLRTQCPKHNTTERVAVGSSNSCCAELMPTYVEQRRSNAEIPIPFTNLSGSMSPITTINWWSY